MAGSIFSRNKKNVQIPKLQAQMQQPSKERQIKEEESQSQGERIHHIELRFIYPNPAQPRRAFDDDAIFARADSIRLYGIIQPLTIRHIGFDTNDGSPIYELIAGERRLRAAKMLGLSDVPCVIIEADERKSAELAIIENIQRENLNMFEQAAAFASLIEIYDLTQEQIAQRLSSSQSYVANKLRLLKLSSQERELILSNNLTERHARTLLRIHDSETRLKVIMHVIENSLNVAKTEEYIDKLLSPAPQISEKAPERRKIIIKDIRMFYNSIDRAVDIVKRAGIDIESKRVENDNTIEVNISIPKSQAVK